jgi:AcrR family transcriptional regulator
MGRRGIRNVEKKIMNALIDASFANGIDSVSTKSMAAHLHISEPVIFSHYHTKQNLMDAGCFEAIAQIPYYGVLPSAEVDINSQALSDKKVKEVKDLVSHKKEIAYYLAYTHSSYCNEEVRKEALRNFLNGIIGTLKTYHTDYSEGVLEVLALNYIDHFATSCAYINKGSSAEDEYIRLFLNGVIVGERSILTDHRVKIKQ